MRAWLWQRRYGLGQIVLVVAAIQVYEAFRRLIDPDWPAAMANARRIADAEKLFGLDWEGWLQQVFLGVPDLVQAMNIFYFVGHFLLTALFFWWLYRRSRPGFSAFRDGFLVATALSLLIHWKFPTAPPRLADVGLVDTLRQLSNIDIGSDQASNYYNPVAAVPSLHAAYAVGVGVGLVRYAARWWSRAVGVVYPLAVVLTIVVTGNHFFLDAVAGVVVLGAGFLVAWSVRARRRAPRGPSGGTIAAATRGGAVR